jgi:hypothetical protein
MSEVKRYIVATLPGRMTRDCVEVVKARDYDALKAENARLRADAERFIWLADRMARYAALVEVNPSDDDAGDKNWFHIEQGEDLRVAIDAALSAGPLEKGHE